MEIQEFKIKVEAVAAALKMSVTFASDEDMRWNKWAHLKGPDNQEIRVENGDYKTKGRFSFSGCFPRNEKGEYLHYGKSTSITVAVDTTPERIAKAIQSRLLPEYLIELKKAIEQTEASNRYHRTRHDNLKKIADHLGVELSSWDGGKTDFIYADIPAIRRIEAYGEDTVKFEVETTPEMAIKIIDLLKSQG